MIEPRESCGVCHDNGSSYGVAEVHAGDPQITVGSVVVARGTTDPNDLLVSFNVKSNGTNFTGLTKLTARSGVDTAYQFNGTLRNTLGAIDTNPAIPGDVITPATVACTTTTATLGNCTNGNYTITIDNGFTAYGTVPSRYLFRLETALGSDGVRAVVTADFPSAPGGVKLVSTAGCSGCHGNSSGSFHYGYPADGAACTVCHDATNTNYPRLIDIGHGIHNSHGMPDGEFILRNADGTPVLDDGVPLEPFEATYPTYMLNCSVCHSSTEALAAANAMPVTGKGCLSCHGSFESESWDFTGATFHNTFTGSENCAGCHFPGSTIARATVAPYHNGAITERGGVIWNGVDTSVVEGDKIAMEITGVTDNGTNLLITWTTKYNGVAVNPCNATAAAGQPVFFNRPATATATMPANNFSFIRQYAVGDDFIQGFGTSPGQPASVTVTTTNTTCASNVATTTIPVDASIARNRRGMLALQGKPAVPNANAAVTTPMLVRALTPTREWVVGTGALPTTLRRPVADTVACRQCHVGSLYQHGGNRVDNVTMCAMCHNSAATEQNIRVGMGVDKTESYDRLVGQTYEFKTMLHAIHSSGHEGQNPIVIYRGNGLYAWAPDKSLLPNWATGAACKTDPALTANNGNIVFGSSPETCRVHNFHTPTYPRSLGECQACHTSSAFKPIPEQAKAAATVLDAGSTTWTNQVDDILQGASAAACTSCHQSTNDKGHAYTNGWTPQAFPNGRQTIIDTK